MVSQHWVPFEPDNRSPWTLRRVVHLHRRAGFYGCWCVIIILDAQLRSDALGNRERLLMIEHGGLPLGRERPNSALPIID